MTCSKFEAKFKFFPSELLVHVLRQIFQLFDDDWNFNQHVIHVDADATLFLS